MTYEMQTMTQILLLIHSVMCSIAGAVACAVSVGTCVAPARKAQLVSRNIAHNVSGVCFRLRITLTKFEYE